MNKLTFVCSEHGAQPVEAIATGKINPMPVRLQLQCGCSWAWRESGGWEQVKHITGFALLASDVFKRSQKV